MTPWVDTDDLIQCGRCLRWGRARPMGRRASATGRRGHESEMHYVVPADWGIDTAGQPVCSACLASLAAVAEHRAQIAERRRLYLASLRRGG